MAQTPLLLHTFTLQMQSLGLFDFWVSFHRSNQRTSTSTLLIPMLFRIYSPNCFEHLRRVFPQGREGTWLPGKSSQQKYYSEPCGVRLLLHPSCKAQLLPWPSLQSLFPPLFLARGHVAAHSSVFETFLVKSHSADSPGMLQNGPCLKPREEKHKRTFTFFIQRDLLKKPHRKHPTVNCIKAVVLESF